MMADELQRRRLVGIVETLRDALTFHHHRDRMNAAIHCADVRWSPLTVKIEEAFTAAKAMYEHFGQEVFVFEVEEFDDG
jgi:hypothetical protein